MNSKVLSTRLDRRRLVAASLAGSALAAGGFRAPARAQGGEVRLGHQKGSATLLILKAEGTLEQRLVERGYTVSWHEFTSGPPLLEALNAGSLDFGPTGAPPPIFAQAAGADLVYALASKPSPRTQAIIVPPDSAIQDPEGLTGAKVAVAKGSSAHALLARALESSGLKWGDAEPVYLQPADAKAAFEGGSVDAWSIWDPYYAAEETATGARTIATDESIGTPNRSFYLASRIFATEHADALDVLRVAIGEADAWADKHSQEVAKLLATETGIDEVTLLRVEERRVYGIEPVTIEAIQDQQQLADMFFELGLIPERIDVSTATLGDLPPAST